MDTDVEPVRLWGALPSPAGHCHPAGIVTDPSGGHATVPTSQLLPEGGDAGVMGPRLTCLCSEHPDGKGLRGVPSSGEASCVSTVGSLGRRTAQREEIHNQSEHPSQLEQSAAPSTMEVVQRHQPAASWLAGLPQEECPTRPISECPPQSGFQALLFRLEQKTEISNAVQTCAVKPGSEV